MREKHPVIMNKKNVPIHFTLLKPELSHQLVLLMVVRKMINDVMGEDAKEINVGRTFV